MADYSCRDEHRFEIEPLGDDRVRLVQSERFRGILVRLFGGGLDKTEHGFAEMNRALKVRAERLHQTDA